MLKIKPDFWRRFNAIILRPWVLVRSGARTLDFPHSRLVLTRRRLRSDEVGRFFYNLAEFVFEYFCDSRRILATFAKFCLNSLFATWSYRYLNPKHVIQRALKLLPHMLFLTQNFTNPSPCSLFCAYEVVQSLHENSMWGTNTRSVLARFGDNNWEKGEGFVKTFYDKKLVWEMEGSLNARWMTCKTIRLCCQKRIETNFVKVAKILLLSQKYSKTNSAKL